jgi:hypothetical protein
MALRRYDPFALELVGEAFPAARRIKDYGMLPLFGMVCVWRRRPLWHENDMTGVTQFIDPHRDTWTGGPQCILLCVRHR